MTVEATAAQHKTNITMSGVELLTQTQAAKLASQFQPQRTLTRRNPENRQEERIAVPAFELEHFFQIRQATSA